MIAQTSSDLCKGSVSVPIAKFADGSESRLRLPIFGSEHVEKGALREPEALVEFTLQTSVPSSVTLGTIESPHHYDR